MKFRIFTADKRMLYSGFAVLSDGEVLHSNEFRPFILMQSTGHVDKNGKDIYVGDIKRVEIEEDFGDMRYYFVCVYVKEWSMFAWVEKDEYNSYVKNGVEALDETMFWTYNVEAESKCCVCGNIYENPEMLTYGYEADRIVPDPELED